MKHLPGIVASLVTLALASSAWSQNRPDFTGSWKVSGAKAGAPASPPVAPPAPPAPGGPPPPPAPPTLVSMVIVQSPTELRIERTMAAGGRNVVYEFRYKLDGSETVNQMGPITVKSRVSWEGPTLVLSNVYSADDRPLGSGRDVHTLDGATLTIESTRNAPMGVIKSKTVLTKEP
jgi:hypothetical protein